MKKSYDYVVIGAGMFGLYAAKILTQKKFSVAVIDKAPEAFTGASYVNQARVHNGYHYPRSVGTAIKAASYFKRFAEEFDFAILKKFEKIYGISEKFSYTSASDFKKFCEELDLPCEETDSSKYFNPGLVEAAFKTEEYAFDALKIRDFLLAEISKTRRAKFFYNTAISNVENTGSAWKLRLGSGETLETPNVINATYGGLNEIISLFGFKPFPLKREYCEIILVKPNRALAHVGITVLDGPFFSIMPFGLSSLHCLSAVSYTPIRESASKELSESKDSQWPSMSQLARKYLIPELSFEYDESLFAVKTVLKSSELDDSRPTYIRHDSKAPMFMSVLSGKINSIFDLEQELP